MKPETGRLFYERITRHHAAGLQSELCDPRVYEYIDDGKAPSPDELLESFIRKEAGAPPHRSTETWIDYAVFLKGSGKAIGRVEATVIDSRAEVAYVFGHRHWGGGYAREAVVWLQGLLAGEYAVRGFWATVRPGNQRSVALLEHLGYAEVARPGWPARLTSYDEGDRVYHRSSRHA